MDVLSFDLLTAAHCSDAATLSDPTRNLRLAIKRLCEELLPEAVGLTNGFRFTDWELDR